MTDDIDIELFLKGVKSHNDINDTVIPVNQNTANIDNQYNDQMMINGFIPFGQNTIYESYLPTMDDYRRWYATYDYLDMQRRIRPNMKSGIFLMDDDGAPIADGLGNIMIMHNMIPMD